MTILPDLGFFLGGGDFIFGFVPTHEFAGTGLIQFHCYKHDTYW